MQHYECRTVYDNRQTYMQTNFFMNTPDIVKSITAVWRNSGWLGVIRKIARRHDVQVLDFYWEFVNLL